MYLRGNYYLCESCWLLVLLLGVNCGDETGCLLPDSWFGSWFLSGYPERIRINERTFGWVGTCHQRVRVLNVLSLKEIIHY